MGTTKSVQIQIATGDLESLKKNGYNLCIAKMVNGVYNVVWQAQNGTQYLDYNTVSWIPTYQVYGANNFQVGVTVEEQTNVVNIQLGEESTLDAAGVMGDPVSGGPPTALTVNNEFAAIYPGVNQLILGQTQPSPIYVAPEQVLPGTVTLTPVEKVQIWFQQELQTSTMFSSAQTNTIEVDLTATDAQTVNYQGGKWALGPLAPPTRRAVRGAAVPPLLTVIVTAVTTVTAAVLAGKIGAKLTGIYSSIAVDVQLTAGKFAITYSEKSGISSSAQNFLTTLRGTVLADQLTAITATTLAELAAPLSALDAKAA